MNESPYRFWYDGKILNIMRNGLGGIISIMFHMKKFKRPKHTVYSIRPIIMFANSNKNIVLDKPLYVIDVYDNGIIVTDKTDAKAIENCAELQNTNLPDDIKMNYSVFTLGVFSKLDVGSTIITVYIGYDTNKRLISEFNTRCGDKDIDVFIPV